MPEELRPGSRFPDLELPDHSGNRRRLADLAAGDPLLLHFYRGFWCPKEQAFFRRLVRLQDEAEVAYTRFVSVSVDPSEVAAAFRAGLGARWTFLCDTERDYQAQLGLRRPPTLSTGPTGRHPSCSHPTWASTRPGTATGSGADRPTRSSARASGP